MSAGEVFWGGAPLGSMHPGFLDDGTARPFPLDQSFGSPISGLLDLPFAEGFTYLARITIYSPEKPGIDILNFSNNGYVDPTSGDVWEKVLVNPYSHSANMFTDGRVSGSSIPSIGEVKIVNTQGELDNIVDWGWNGATVEHFIGLKTDSFADNLFENVGTTIASGLEYNTTMMTLMMRDRRQLMDRDLQENEYKGLGWGLDFRNGEGADGIEFPPVEFSSFTIEFLARIDSFAGSGIHWFWGNSNGAVPAHDGMACWYDITADQLIFRFKDGTDSTNLTADNTEFLENTLHRVSMSHDGFLTGDSKLYIDGELVDTVSVPGTNTFQSYIDQQFGADIFGAGDQGQFMSDFRVWSTARTQEEIQELMFQEIDVPLAEPGLIYYYKMNEGAGTTTFNATNNTVSSDSLDLATSTYEISFGDNYDWEGDSDPSSLPNRNAICVEILAEIDSAPAGDAPIVAKKAGSGSGNAGWALYVDSSGFVNAVISDGTNQYSISYDVSVADSVARRYTLNLDPGVPFVQSPNGELHVDGFLIGIFNPSTGLTNTTTNSENCLVGGDWGGNEVDMKVTDIRVWERDRGMNLDTGNSRPDLIASWIWKQLDNSALVTEFPARLSNACHLYLCDEGTGTTITDTGNATAINGTLSNASAWTASGITVARNLTVNANSWSSTYEGTVDMAGKKKPLCYGEPYGAEFVLIDPKYLIYQFNDGESNALNELREGGSVLDLESDTTDIYRQTFSTEDYFTDLSRSLIRLKTEPAFPIDGDVEGLKLSGTYTNLPSDILRMVASRHGTITDPDDVETGSFNVLVQSDHDRPIGLQTGTSPVKKSKILDDIALSISATWGFTRGGSYRVGLISDPGGKAAATEIDASMVRNQGIKSILLPAPTWKQIVGYKKQWNLLDINDLTGQTNWTGTTGVGDVVAQLTTEFRTVSSKDDTILTIHPEAEPETIDTLLVTQEDAKWLADLRLILYGSVDQRFYELDLIAQMFKHEINDLVFFTFPRFNLDNGNTFRVMNVTENAGSSLGRERARVQIWRV